MAKILVVECKKGDLDDVKVTLLKVFPDVKLFFAENGKKGLELCHAESPDVILINLDGSQMDGFEFCTQLKTNDYLKIIPILMVVDERIDNSLRFKALELGVDAFLSKPIDEPELIAQIKIMFRIKKNEDIQLGKNHSLSQLVIERTHELEKELIERKRTEEELQHSFNKLEFSKVSTLNLMEDLKREILERKAAEDRISKLNERLTLAKTAAKFGVWDIDLVENNLIWDDIMYDLYGMGNYKIPINYYTWLEAIFEDDRDKISLITKQTLEGNADYNIEFRIVHPDDSIRYMKGLGLVVRNSSNIPIRITGINYDITETKKAEEALKDSKSKLDLALNSAQMGVWYWDIIENKRYFDSQTCSILGIDPKTFKGTEKEFFNVIHPDDRLTIVYSHTRTIENNDFYNPEYRVVWPNGSIHYINSRGRLVYDESGIPLRLNGVLWDVTEQRIAQEALRLSNQRMRLLFEQTPLGVIEWDKEFRVSDWNPSAGKIFGYKKEEALGQHFNFLTKPNGPYQVNEIALSLIKHNGGHRSTNENITKQGTTIICEWFNTTLVDSDGKTFGVASLVHDITERRQAEIDLQVSNKQWDTTFNSIQDGIMVLDENQRIIKYNKAAVDQMGRRINQSKNPYCYSTVHGTSCAIEGCPFVKMKVSKEREILSYELDNRYYDCMIDPIFDEKGKVSGAVHIIYDITERKMAELNLIKKNNEVQSLLNAATLVLDLEKFEITARKLLSNCKDLIGADSGFVALLNQNDTDDRVILIDPCDSVYIADSELPQLVKNLYAQVYKSGKPLYQNYFSKTERTTLKSSKYNSIKNVLFAPLIINKKIVGIIGLLNKDVDFSDDDMDIATAYGELASLALHNTRTLNELVHQKEKAEESEILKSVFLANMSHEIRTPLNSILGFSEFLCEPSISNEKRKKFVDIINASGQQLLHIINDIIDISRLESKQLKLFYEEFNLYDILNNIIEIFSNSEICHSKPNIKLILKLPAQYSDLIIKTDKVRFQQVLINIISNAIKYTNEGFVEVSLEIKSKENNAFIEFCIKDTGIGISVEKFDIIFERFRQVEENDYREGTGLGLSISKGLIDLLGGKIWFESEVNIGTSFYFTLPYNISNTNNKKIELTKAITYKDLTDKTLIIAEDDYNSFCYLKELLFDSKANIIHAEDGQILLNLLEKEKADLVFLDINMPLKTGYQCIKEIREKGYQVKVIAQTAYAMVDEKEKCLDLGCDGYISKPFTKKTIINAINEVLGN
ncbi:MAG: PAS domain S-box protein [Bacteroidales bacterium]|nr:PAS domain S-box protein [Bacteroidales bacterium]